MSPIAIIACVALGVALSELVFLCLIVAAFTAKDAWDARQWRKRHPSPALGPQVIYYGGGEK